MFPHSAPCLFLLLKLMFSEPFWTVSLVPPIVRQKAQQKRELYPLFLIKFTLFFSKVSLFSFLSNMLYWIVSKTKGGITWHLVGITTAAYRQVTELKRNLSAVEPTRLLSLCRRNLLFRARRFANYRKKCVALLTSRSSPGCNTLPKNARENLYDSATILCMVLRKTQPLLAVNLSIFKQPTWAYYT